MNIEFRNECSHLAQLTRVSTMGQSPVLARDKCQKTKDVNDDDWSQAHLDPSAAAAGAGGPGGPGAGVRGREPAQGQEGRNLEKI